MERRLAAILAADVVGYSRLIEANPLTGVSPIETLRSCASYGRSTALALGA